MSQSVLSIGETTVRQLDDLFSLNDLHAAAGSASKHQPSNFLRLETTQALVAEIKSSDVRNCVQITRGATGGTYACRELVIAYAAWISAAFHLKVIRVFLEKQAQPAPTSTIRLSDLISAGNGIYIDTEELHRIAAACMEKLASRAKFYQARELASRTSGKAVSMSI